MQRLKGQGIIAAGHPATAQAGQMILASGGNAFDAVLAALMAAFFAEPLLAAPAGGGFLTAGTRSGRRVFDFFCQTPMERLGNSDLYPILGNFGKTQQEFHIGLGSVATPGVVAGIHSVHQSLCSMPLSELAQPAIELAKAGVPMNAFQAYIGEILHPIVAATAPSRELHCDASGAPFQPGAVFRNDKLLSFVEQLVREPEDWFYRGEPAAALAQLCRQSGGHLSRADLQSYEVVLRRPLTRSVAGHHLHTNPTPSCGGILIAFALAILEESLPPGANPSDPDHALTLALAMDAANQARKVSEIDLNPTTDFASMLLGEHLEHHTLAVEREFRSVRGTTHISVADSFGQLAALTVTNGEGCGHMLPDTGIMLNNMLGEEDVNPHGLDQWPANQRISSMMAPSLITNSDGFGLALGSGGSNRIRTAITQVIANMLMLGCDLEQSITAPRMHLEDELLSLEPNWASASIDALQKQFSSLHQWDGQNLFFGGVHAAGFDASGRRIGSGDPRRGGICLSA